MRRFALATLRHTGLALILSVVVALLASGAAVGWLSRHSLPLTPLVPFLSERLSDPATGRVVGIDDVTLIWADDAFDGNGRLEIHLAGVSVKGADGQTLAAAPEAVLGLSVSGLVRGSVRPTRLELVGPRVIVFRRADDSLGLTVAEPETTPEATDTVPVEEGATPVVADALRALAAPPDRTKLLGLLRMVAVRDGDVTVIDPGRGLRWHANPTRIDLRRGEGGVEGDVRLSLDVGSAPPVPVEASLRFDAAERRTRIAATFSGLIPDTVADAAEALAPVRGVAVPISGTLSAIMGGDFRLDSLDFAFEGAKGEVAVPTPEGETRYAVNGARLAGSLAPRVGRLKVDDLHAAMVGGTLGEMELTASGDVEYDRPVPLGSLRARVVLNEREGSGAAGGRVATVALSAVEAPDGEIAVDGAVDELEPARFARLAPFLEPASAFDGLVSGSISARLSADGRPLSGSGRLGLGSGTLDLPGLMPRPLRLGGALLSAEADRESGGYHLTIERLELTDGADGPSLTAEVGVRREGGGGGNGRDRLRAALSLANLPMTDLDRYWPPMAGAKPRKWVVDNVTGGHLIAGDAVFEGSFPTPAGNAIPTAADLEAIRMEELNARLETRDLEIHFFRPLPPVRGVRTAAANYDGKDINIITTGGEVTVEGLTPVRAEEARVKITNIATPREDLYIDVDLTGPLRTIMTVIDLPPLGYPSKLDIVPARTGGAVDGRLYVSFPLFDDLKLDDIVVQVEGRGREVALSKLVLGRDVDRGEVDVFLDTAGMSVGGKARFDGVPIAVEWRERFSPKEKEPRTELTARGRADFRKVAEFAPVLGPYGSGPTDLVLTYRQMPDNTATLDTRFDLAPTALKLGPLSWSKAKGVPAKGTAMLRLRDGDLVRIDGITVEGGDVSAEGTVIFNRRGEPSRIEFPRVKAGATDVAIVATAIKGPGDKSGAEKGGGGGLNVEVTGATFDASDLLKGDGEAGAEKTVPDPKSPRMLIDMTVNRLLFGADRWLSDAKVRLVREEGEWNNVALRGSTNPSGLLSVRMGPSRDGGSRIRIDADDAGAAFRALDITDRIKGGNLSIRGRSAIARPRAPVQGTISLRDYTVVDAPALAKLINAMSITGLADLLKGEGIGFGSLSGRFSRDRGKLTLSDVRTAGGALGLTVEGEIDLDDERARLNGTIVPVYGLNRIVGQIPLLGDLLSGGPGQGIFAATWTLNGPLSDPDVSVNPLALLAPGFLRQLFFSGPGTSDGGETSPDDDPFDGPGWDHSK